MLASSCFLTLIIFLYSDLGSYAATQKTVQNKQDFSTDGKLGLLKWLELGSNKMPIGCTGQIALQNNYTHQSSRSHGVS